MKAATLYTARYHQKKRDQGLCRMCSNPLATANYCRYHQDRINAQKRKRKADRASTAA